MAPTADCLPLRRLLWGGEVGSLKARPIYHHKRESIKAHVNIVMVVLATGHVLEQYAQMSVKRLVRTLWKYRSFTVEVAASKCMRSRRCLLRLRRWSRGCRNRQTKINQGRLDTPGWVCQVICVGLDNCA